MSDPGLLFDTLVGAAGPVFTGPSSLLFRELLEAWVLCPCRRTVTGMLGMLEPHPRRAHDAYHRFLRAGAWSLKGLWRVVAEILVATLAAAGVLHLDLDDTLFHKSGRKVNGAAIFRDPVRSVGKRVVYALGLNVVVLTLRITPPWGGPPLGLPINLRLYRKGGRSHLDLAEEMIREVAGWFPDRVLVLCADGAYASLAGRSLPRTQVISRLRRDAALYKPPPPRRKGQRGRPRKKGVRLPNPEKIASRTRKGWCRESVDRRGRTVERLLLSRPVLWYQVCPDQPVLFVIVRDPAGIEPDDFFFTTDLETTAADVAGCYAGRWSIEITFRSSKQDLGAQEPQSWKKQGPERAVGMSLVLYSLVWLWYLSSYGIKRTWTVRPWYRQKATPSFADAMSALRRVLWQRRIFTGSDPRPLTAKMAKTLVRILARAG